MSSAMWVEKYRPTTFNEVKGQLEIIPKIRAFIEKKNMPHLMFAGPAGVGKCVVGETPILTGEGELLPIEEAYKRKINSVLSLDSKGEIVKGKITYFYKDKAEQLVKIETQSGNNIETTKKHPFLVLEDGIPKWKHAEQLEKGMPIAIPTEYCAIEKDIPINWPEERVWAILKKTILTEVSQLYTGTKKLILAFLEKQKTATTSEIAEGIKCKGKTVLWGVKELEKENLVTIENGNPLRVKINKIFVKTKNIPFKNAQREDITHVYYKSRFQNTSHPITYFNRFSPVFFEWLGLVLGDGSTGIGCIRFHNNNKELRDHFTRLSYKIFGNKIKIKYYTKGANVSVVITKARIITKFLEHSLRIPINKKKAGIIKVPKEVFNLPKKHAAMLIRGFYECDGYFNKRQKHIEISSKSNNFIYQLKYLFLRFGISSRIKKRKEQSYLTISGGEHLRKFSTEIKPLFKKVHNIKSEETNIDCLEIPSNLNTILKNLGIQQKELGKMTEVGYIFERKRSSRRKIKRMYGKIVKLARERITDAIKTRELIENIETININECIANLSEELENSKRRNKVQKITNIRYDRLKEYAEKKRMPSLTNFLKVMNATRSTNDNEEEKNIGQILVARWAILETIQKLGISYNKLAENIGISPTSVISILNRNSIAIQSINALQQICLTVRQEIEERICNEEMIETLQTLEFLSAAKIQWDNIKTKETREGTTVYDLNVEKHHNFIGGFGPMILHNSTTALVIARQLFGESWKDNFLELNASDERGIDVVRTKVKDFARTRSIGDVPFKIIFLDECDALTKEAQQALRRTMERYTQNARFILSCNFSSKILDPIQSRCTVFRFRPLEKEQMFQIFEKIAKEEGLTIDENAKDALYVSSKGDCRRAENILQSCAAVGTNITEDVVFSLASVAKPKEITEFLQLAMQNKFIEARNKMLDTMLRYGLSGLDIIKQIQREVWNLNVDDRTKVSLIDKCGEIEFRMVEGSDEFVQLEALLAQFTLINSQK